MKNVVSTLAGVTLALGMAAAHASGFGLGAGGSIDVSGYTGNANGYAYSATNGGSVAQGNVVNTGLSTQFSTNQGAAYSGAGAVINNASVVTYTVGGSTASHTSAGYTVGNAYGETQGGVANNYKAESFGTFDAAGFGGTFDLDLGIGFGSW